MKRLWLDDVRPAPDGWVWVKNYDDALAQLTLFSFEAISLDHDLGMKTVTENESGIVVAKEVEAKTGYDVICWIEEQVFDGAMDCPKIILCHSANPEGKRRIELAINNLKKIFNTRP